MLTMAWHLATRLTGTMAALRDRVMTRFKAEIIVRATVTLEPEEAKQAEAKVLDRAGRLTPGSLRTAIARAVMEVAPEKARKRREEARKDARVERWQEDSGNAALAGFELPPDEALAADQRITWWARELKKAGLEGDMDVLRARAFLDLVLGKDSRPGAEPTAKPCPFLASDTIPVPEPVTITVSAVQGTYLQVLPQSAVQTITTQVAVCRPDATRGFTPPVWLVSGLAVLQRQGAGDDVAHLVPVKAALTVTPCRRQPRQVGDGLLPPVLLACEQFLGLRQHQRVRPSLPPGLVPHRQPG
jgi:hypothetical protein